MDVVTSVMDVFLTLRKVDRERHGRVLEDKEADGDVRVAPMTLPNAITTAMDVFFGTKVTFMAVKVAFFAPSTIVS